MAAKNIGKAPAPKNTGSKPMTPNPVIRKPSPATQAEDTPGSCPRTSGKKG